MRALQKLRQRWKLPCWQAAAAPFLALLRWTPAAPLVPDLGRGPALVLYT